MKIRKIAKEESEEKKPIDILKSYGLRLRGEIDDAANSLYKEKEAIEKIANEANINNDEKIKINAKYDDLVRSLGFLWSIADLLIKNSTEEWASAKNDGIERKKFDFSKKKSSEKSESKDTAEQSENSSEQNKDNIKNTNIKTDKQGDEKSDDEEKAVKSEYNHIDSGIPKEKEDEYRKSLLYAAVKSLEDIRNNKTEKYSLDQIKDFLNGNVFNKDAVYGIVEFYFQNKLDDPGYNPTEDEIKEKITSMLSYFIENIDDERIFDVYRKILIDSETFTKQLNVDGETIVASTINRIRRIISSNSCNLIDNKSFTLRRIVSLAESNSEITSQIKDLQSAINKFRNHTIKIAKHISSIYSGLSKYKSDERVITDTNLSSMLDTVLKTLRWSAQLSANLINENHDNANFWDDVKKNGLKMMAEEKMTGFVGSVDEEDILKAAIESSLSKDKIKIIEEDSQTWAANSAEAVSKNVAQSASEATSKEIQNDIQPSRNESDKQTTEVSTNDANGQESVNQTDSSSTPAHLESSPSPQAEVALSTTNQKEENNAVQQKQNDEEQAVGEGDASIDNSNTEDSNFNTAQEAEQNNSEDSYKKNEGGGPEKKSPEKRQTTINLINEYSIKTENPKSKTNDGKKTKDTSLQDDFYDILPSGVVNTKM